MTYTEDDVKRLVSECQAIVDRLKNGYIQPVAEKDLIDALKPFRPDPDQPLIDLITDLRGQSGYQDNAAIIQAVRAHDAKHGGPS